MASESIALTEAVFYILLALHTPLHGYGIMQKVEVLSAGRVKLAAGTLYGALSTMVEKGWIRALPGESSRRKKEYEITEQGRAVTRRELERLKELVKNGEDIVGGAVGCALVKSPPVGYTGGERYRRHFHETLYPNQLRATV